MTREERTNLLHKLIVEQEKHRQAEAELGMMQAGPIITAFEVHTLYTILPELLQALNKLEDGLNEAVRMEGDDLCWLDFAKLKTLFGVEFDPARLPRDCMMQNCSVFYDAMVAAKPYEADELTKRINALTVALHDAIRRPMGVVPESAEPFVTEKEIEAAERRRPRT